MIAMIFAWFFGGIIIGIVVGAVGAAILIGWICLFEINILIKCTSHGIHGILKVSLNFTYFNLTVK